MFSVLLNITDFALFLPTLLTLRTADFNVLDCFQLMQFQLFSLSSWIRSTPDRVFGPLRKSYWRGCLFTDMERCLRSEFSNGQIRVALLSKHSKSDTKISRLSYKHTKKQSFQLIVFKNVSATFVSGDIVHLINFWAASVQMSGNTFLYPLSSCAAPCAISFLRAPHCASQRGFKHDFIRNWGHQIWRS